MMGNQLIEKLEFTLVYMGDITFLQEMIADCEGKHTQQVAYSTYHKALTQLCFTCQTIRTTMPMTSQPTHKEEKK